jgi:hypothetical protein
MSDDEGWSNGMMAAKNVWGKNGQKDAKGRTVGRIMRGGGFFSLKLP